MLPARCALHGLFVCFACLSRLANTYFSVLTHLSGIYGVLHTSRCVYNFYVLYLFISDEQFYRYFPKGHLNKENRK